jgi:hypothetical protein
LFREREKEIRGMNKEVGKERQGKETQNICCGRLAIVPPKLQILLILSSCAHVHPNGDYISQPSWQ